ncbi:MAG TPA: DinB family protein [Actinomycetota bacterium]|nr:DinB family protein [Actinomycetota bacterium]
MGHLTGVPSATPPLQAFYDGWANYQRLLLDMLGGLTSEQLRLRTAPHQWAVWQLAAHLAGSRAYWFHDVLGEGDPEVREMFRVESTTIPGLPIEDAGWEDDETQPRGPAEIVVALERTWAMIADCLGRWAPGDLAAEFSRRRRTGDQTVSRQWVIWHLIEHDLNHGGEISQILGSHHVPALDL